MSRTAAALAGLALLACTSCARPVTPGTLAPQAANGVGQGTPLPFGPPARPGLDGPIPQGAIDVPATPFIGDAPMQRTTAELMRAAAFAAPASTADRPIVRKVRPNRRTLPADSGSPPGSRGPLDPSDTLVAPAAPSAPMAAAPNVDLVNSTENAGYTPPDTMGDVGPAQYLTIVNGRMRTVDKASGAADGVIDLNPDVFFAAVRNGQATGDPRVRYDRRSGRWFVLAFTIAVPNRYVLAVSDGATITGSTVWTYHQWANTHVAVTTGNGCLGDYPTLGIDEDALYIGVNQFCGTSVSGSLAWDGSTAYVIRKATLPGALVVSLFDNLLTNTSGAGPYTPQGVDNRDANTTTGYFIGVDGFATGKLAMRRVIDPGGTPSISGNIAIGAAQGVLATAVPTDVSQPGVVHLLSGGDDRLMNAVIRNGRLWTVHQVEVGGSGSASASGGRNGERWYELQGLGTTGAAAAPTVRQTGTVFDGAASSANSFWMGTLNVTGQGHVTLGMSRAGASTSTAAATTGFANAAVSGRLATDPLGVMATPALYTANTAFTLTVYNGGTGTTVKRWGDYSSTSVDPDDDMTTWTLQEYLSANDRWAIRLVRIAAPPPPALVSLFPASVPAGQTDVTVTVTGSASGGAGFFDPGAGFARRIAAAFSDAGVVVTGVTVDTPMQLTLTLDTTGAATGARTLTVTNPDGQLVSLANALSVTPPSNIAPLAADDAYQTPFGLALTVAAPGVLANDSDADLDALSALLVGAPSSGTLALDADGSFSFTPAIGFAGEVAFTYRASDGVSSSGVSTVTLTVAENAAPSLSTFANRSLFDTGAGPGVASGPIAMNVGDLEGGAAAVTVSASSSNQAVVATGSITVTGSGASRMLAFTTVPGAAGATTMAVAATDGFATTTRSFVVTLTRSTPPVAAADSFATGRGQALTVPPPGVLANDSDADGQPLTAVLVSPPAAGSFTLTPTGSVWYTPDAGFAGPATFTYRASDGVLTSEVVTGTITVSANAFPVITAPPSQSVVDEGSGVIIGPLPFSVGDPDGDSPVVTVTSSNPEALAPVGIVLGGSGTSRTITLSSPAGGPGGTTTITLSVSDGLVTSTATFVVTVRPRRGTPTRLSAVVARHTVVFAWAPPPVSLEPITGYVLEAGAAPGAPLVAVPLGERPALTVSVPDGAFFVRVRSLTAGGVSSPSNEVRIATGQAAPPLAPGAFLATVQGSAITLQWAENPAGPVITAYQLQAGTSAGASDLGVMPLPPTARGFSAAGGPGPYFVRLAAANEAGAGPVSNEVVLAPGPGVCTRPATPSGLAAATRPGGVAVTWSAPVDGGIPAGYHVDLGTAPGAANVAAAALPVTTSVGGGLAPGTYYLRLSASNACGASAAAPEISFTVP